MEQGRLEREKRFGGGRGRGRGRGRGGYNGPQDAQSASGEQAKPPTKEEMMQKAKLDLKHELASATTEEHNKKVEEAVKSQMKKMSDAKNDAKVAAYVDKVELGKDGYKFRYYSDKFHVHSQEDQQEF